MNLFPSMNHLTLEIHLAVFTGFVFFMTFLGFLIGRKQVAKKQKKILEIENEMLTAHNEILEFAKRNKQLTDALEKAKIPLPLFPAQREDDEESDDKVRKIPLGKIG
jgi:hypothetical protein